MDPSSLSVSNDPHHPPQFTAFPPFTNSNHLFQALPQTPLVPPCSSFNHPPYSEMICTAIAALNEPDGSSEQAISRCMERINPGLPSAHGPLLKHHLKNLKKSGVLMKKKSYKFAAARPRKDAVSRGPSGQQDAGYGGLRKKFELFAITATETREEHSEPQPQPEAEGQGQAQTEAEAVQEALL